MEGSVGPVIGVVIVIIILGLMAGVVGRICSGRSVMGRGNYDFEAWVETKCSTCIDGRVDPPPPQRRHPVTATGTTTTMPPSNEAADMAAAAEGEMESDVDGSSDESLNETEQRPQPSIQLPEQLHHHQQQQQIHHNHHQNHHPQQQHQKHHHEDRPESSKSRQQTIAVMVVGPMTGEVRSGLSTLERIRFSTYQFSHR